VLRIIGVTLEALPSPGWSLMITTIGVASVAVSCLVEPGRARPEMKLCMLSNAMTA